MGILFADGFDSYAATSDLTKKWLTSASPWAWVSNAGRNGGGGLQAATTGGSAIKPMSAGLSANSLVCFAFWLKISTAPALSVLVQIRRTTGAAGSSLRVTAAGKLALYNASSSLQAAGSVNVCDGNWHWCEWHLNNAVSATNKLYVDGLAEWNGPLSPENGTTVIDAFELTSIASVTVTIDDIIVWDASTGNPQPSDLPLGPRQITTVRPQADSAVSFATATSIGNGDAYLSSVKLLMGFEGTNNSVGSPGMTDESSAAHGTATVVGNAKISTASPLLGTSSLALDGAGDYISFAHSTDWVLSGQFTIEFKVKLVAFTVPVATFLAHGGGTFYAWKISVSNAGTIHFQLDNGNDGTADYNVTSGAADITTGVTYTIAVDRDATNKIRLYLNGTMIASQTGASLSSATASNTLSIGSDASFDTNGTIDEVRITNGIARYASDGGYTVSSSAFPRSAPTHAAQVNETNADGDTSYVESAGSGDQDLYDFAAMGISPATITAVVANAYVENPNPGVINVKQIAKSNATQTDGTSVQAPSSYRTLQQSFPLDPNTSAAWASASAVDSATFGVKVP